MLDLGSVDLSHLRTVRIRAADVSLASRDGEQLQPGFAGCGRGSQSGPELTVLELVIAEINARLGGNLTDADKVWVQQAFEYAAEDDHIQQAARATTEGDSGYVVDKQLEGLVPDRRDASAELVDRVFQDRETADFFTAMARKIVYQLVRGFGHSA